VFSNVPGVGGSFTGRSDKHRAFDRIADRDQWSDRGTFPLMGFGQEWRLRRLSGSEELDLHG
jgi:hypothetical protein